MAATFFKSVSAATAAGQAISDVVGVDVNFEGDFSFDKTDGDTHPVRVCNGQQSLRATVTARDPISLLAARGDSGASSFTIGQGGDATGGRSFSLGTTTAAANFQYSLTNGEPGSGSIEIIRGGTTFTAS